MTGIALPLDTGLAVVDARRDATLGLRRPTEGTEQGQDTRAGTPEPAVQRLYKAVTGAYPAVQGVPQMRLSNPFPSSSPVVPAYKKSLGRYTGLGDSLSYVAADRPRSRFGCIVERQGRWYKCGEARAVTPEEGETIHWGEAEFVAQEEMDRNEGY